MSTTFKNIKQNVKKKNEKKKKLIEDTRHKTHTNNECWNKRKEKEKYKNSQWVEKETNKL